MKKQILFRESVALLSITLCLSSCYSSRSGVGTVLAGATAGNLVGRSAGFLRNGPYGGDRGAAIGTLVGAAAGTAVVVGEAAHNRVRSHLNDVASSSSTISGVRVSSISGEGQNASGGIDYEFFRFMDAQGSPVTTLVRGNDYIYEFVLHNVSGATLRDVRVNVLEEKGCKGIAISETAPLPTLEAGASTHYRVRVRALQTLKKGTARFTVSVSANNEPADIVDRFELATAKK